MAEEHAPEAQVTPGRDVFISYASQDKAVADAIVEALERNGLRCWIAPRDVRPGTVYADAIVGAINGSKALVLILSANAMPSAHVGREVERAASKHKQLIAFRVDTTPLSRELEYFLSNSQWIDVGTGGIHAATAKLIDAIRSHLTPGTPSAPSKPLAADRKLAPSKRRWIVIAIAIVALTLAVFFAPRFGLPGHSPALQSSTAATISDKSIAVLPFTDMSEKKDQGYLADGIAEEVRTRLSQIPGFQTTGESSSLQFRDSHEDVKRIGQTLGVEYVVQGTLRRGEGRVRVAVQLLDAKSGRQRWSDNIESDANGAFDLQAKIAAGIAAALHMAVEADLDVRDRPTSSDAYDAYLRALEGGKTASLEAFERTEAYYERALQLDPTFAPAAAGLARLWAAMATYNWIEPSIIADKTRRAVALAEKLDPKAAEPHLALAMLLTVYDFDWVAAEKELATAAALQPPNCYYYITAANLANSVGHWDEARRLIRQALVLDPLDASSRFELAWGPAFHTAAWDELDASIRSTMEVDPNFATLHQIYGQSLLLRHRIDEAKAEFQKESPGTGRLEGLAEAAFAAGNKAASDQYLKDAIAFHGKLGSYWIAEAYAYRGERDQAIDWLNQAYDRHDAALVMLKDDPMLSGIQDDPRFKEFLRKMKLSE